MHGAKNYPLFKETSNLDIELSDATAEEEYPKILREALPRIFMHDPNLVFTWAAQTHTKKISSGD